MAHAVSVLMQVSPCACPANASGVLPIATECGVAADGTLL